jgi:hypothetical protein
MGDEEKLKSAIKSGVQLGFFVGLLLGLLLSTWAVFGLYYLVG